MEKGTRADYFNHRLRVGSLVNATSLHCTVAGGSEENTAPPESRPYRPGPHSPSGKARDSARSSVKSGFQGFILFPSNSGLQGRATCCPALACPPIFYIIKV